MGGGRSPSTRPCDWPISSEPAGTLRFDHYRRSRSPRLTKVITKSGRRALAAAAIFHVILTLSVFSLGRLGVTPQKFDSDGIGEFAKDSRGHKAGVDSLVSLLKQGAMRSWVNSGEPLHVKVYSLGAVLVEPLLDSNILAAEPVNLFCYLAILVLTFILGRIVAGERAAWLAALVVGIWPSLLLHTTQFLRDPLVLTAALTIMTVLVILLQRDVNWPRATGIVLAGVVAIFLVWHTRPEIWLVITAIVFAATGLLLIKIVFTRKLLPVNLLAMASLAVLSIAMPRPAVGVVSLPLTSSPASPGSTASSAPSIASRVAIARNKFMVEGRNVSGSLIDDDVVFSSSGDVIRYIPRALEIGYLAPFPSMWFKSGYSVGLLGRVISGLETTLTYLIEILACIFVWRHKGEFGAWLLVLATVLGMVALGLVVANLGTLYRMRYPFWILLVIMGVGSLVDLYKPRTFVRKNDLEHVSCRRRPRR
jgi:hypothetical protein